MKNVLILLSISILASCKTLTNDQVDYGSNSVAGKYLEINDIKVYYEIYGEGEPLLLLHGNGGSINNFAGHIPTLSKYFKVIAVDSRAQGRSTDSGREITYALMASDMSELIDKLKLESVYVVGWSDGGNIGLELAFSHPGQVKKLVTLGANYIWENCFVAPDSAKMDPDDPIILKVSPMLQKFNAGRNKIAPEIMKNLTALTEKYPNFTTGQLKQIKTPTLVVAGDHDLIALDLTATLFRNLPHAQLFIVPGASHFGLVEQPELILGEIKKFLQTPYRDMDPYYFTRFLHE